jgi:hypothetical protein
VSVRGGAHGNRGLWRVGKIKLVRRRETTRENNDQRVKEKIYRIIQRIGWITQIEKPVNIKQTQERNKLNWKLNRKNAGRKRTCSSASWWCDWK